uniref:Uncharacterized protein n=1 Tax=Craspedostauros australis TaxID=1486917 RepID=A0A7R9WRM1_9STRA|mmetsp:Transcript_175/g.449  ORF Transcript_175/g.449 Transcript_175/m.449 type:complete len:175 (+) Transcript_175:261-785(+)
MMRSRSTFTFMLFAALLVLSTVSAQFGVPKQQEVKPDGQQQEASTPGQGELDGILSQQDATDIDHLVQQAKQDPETMHLVEQMKASAGGELDALRQLSPVEILGGLKQTVDDMKVIDYLFKDGDKAFEEMKNAGMINEEHLETYRKDPSLLEEDTRRSLYFQFVSLAVVGGLIE